MSWRVHLYVDMLHVLIVSILDAPFLKNAESLPFCEDGLVNGDDNEGVPSAEDGVLCPCCSDELLFVAAATFPMDDDDGPTDRSPGNVVGCL